MSEPAARSAARPTPVGYADRDQDRWVAETGASGRRTAFARDRARVLHSGALRRLAGKTQVVEPGGPGIAVPRTRLTHSLECAQVGREFGAALGCDPDLVDAACLAHDLGHPPYGHNGEDALDDVASDCGGFEGNAQSLRVLTRLEIKVPGAGLNLSRAALDAATKYPWPRTPGRRKYGVYADDLAVFGWLREGVQGERRCLETQVMDWADDVAYSVHDLEDGIIAGLVPIERWASAEESDALCALAADSYSEQSAPDLQQVWTDLLASGVLPATVDPSPRGQAGLKTTTSTLIGRFCTSAEQATPRGVRPAGPDALRRRSAGARADSRGVCAAQGRSRRAG